MRITTGIVAITVAAVGIAACSGGGVSQAEHDQVLAELAVAQQALVEARTEFAESEVTAGEVDAMLAEVEGAVLDALGLRGITADPGRDRVELLAEAVAATTEERDMLLLAIESGGGEFGAGADQEHIAILLSVAATAQDWTRPSVRPADADALEALAPHVDQISDEMLTLAFEQLVAQYDGASSEGQIDLLIDVSMSALERARSEIAP